MSATWAAVAVAVFAQALAIGALAWKAGRRDGKIDSALERLTTIVEDHEDRIRVGEGRRARRR